MIRPITLVCWILALSAGLYLYHAKHQVELIDQQIDQIAKQTADLRVESRGLLDQWIRLGEPEQLHKYSDEYLGLQPITPTQFARLSDLPARLPPPQAEPTEPPPDAAAPPSDGISSGPASPSAAATDSLSPHEAATGDQISAVQSSAPEPAVADQDRANAGDDGDLPVPPIPPAVIPVARVSALAATTLPLQARPVTPRPADNPAPPDAARARNIPPAHNADQTATLATRLAPGTTPIEPRQGAPGPGNAPGQSGVQEHGLPPLQAQGPRDAAGLPPLQAQAPTSQAMLRPTGQPSRPPARSADVRSADMRGNEWDGRPVEAQTAQHPTTEPHGPVSRQAEPAQIARAQAPAMAPPPGGSLLGISRGSAPLPLPAPTPVNANGWGSASAGPVGPGR